MPRRNTAAHGRRLKAHPAAFAGEPNTIGPEGMARSLVERGLASEVILDYPTRLDQSKENRRRGTTLEGRRPT